MNQKGFAGIILVGAFAVLFVGGAVTAVASDSSKPGDTLYSVDRGLESFRSTFILSSAGEIKFDLKQADERLKELKELKSSEKIKEDIDKNVEKYKNAAEDYEKNVSESTNKILALADHKDKISVDLVDEVTNSYKGQLDDLAEVRKKLPEKVEHVVSKAMGSSEFNIEKALVAMNDNLSKEKKEEIIVKIQKSKELSATAGEKVQKALDKLAEEKNLAQQEKDITRQQIIQNVQTIIVSSEGSAVASPGQPGSTSAGSGSSSPGTPGSTSTTPGTSSTSPGSSSSGSTTIINTGDTSAAFKEAKIEAVKEALDEVQAEIDKANAEGKTALAAALKRTQDLLKDTMAKLDY